MAQQYRLYQSATTSPKITDRYLPQQLTLPGESRYQGVKLLAAVSHKLWVSPLGVENEFLSTQSCSRVL
ncbi:MAG: hypothetical protein F6K16_14250 [Symploca sp. SIO2B6]|nr:hypothetical protein [Symploca sp. SIO2B6]